jgi:carbon storage regulator
MLVLSRKSGERIRIGDNITIEVRRIAGNRVALAFEAPHDVRILRGELQLFEENPPAETPSKSESPHVPLYAQPDNRHLTT